MSLSIPILMYHKIGAPVRIPADRLYNVSAAAFAAQMRFLARCGFQGVTVANVVDGLNGQRDLPARPVAVTFDDAFTGVADFAAPVLHQLGWPATVYVPTARVGQTNMWDAAQGLPQLPLMDWPALHGLHAAGWEIGAHTRTHANLSLLPDAEVRQEVEGSAMECAEQMGIAVRTFAYPYGVAGSSAPRHVREAGMDGACGTQYGLAGPKDDRMALPRVHIGYRYGVWGLAYSLWVGPRLGRPLS